MMFNKETGIAPDIYPPPDIAGFFGLSFHVPRYENVPFLTDYTGQHILRTISRFERTATPAGLNREIVRRTLWLHDLPEIITGDRSIVVKEADTKLNGEVNDNELQAANRIFSDQEYPGGDLDFALWKAFHDSGEALRGGKHTKIQVNPEAVIAKIIDIVDGNAYFHHVFTEWIAGLDYSPNLLPDENTMGYSLRSYQTVTKNLAGMDLPEHIRDFAADLMRQKLLEIAGCWKNLPASLAHRTPPAINSLLEEIERITAL